MKFEILHIEDTPDGGAIITIEADRNLLHYAFEQFLNQAIMDKVNEVLNGEAEARTLVEEDELPSESDQDEYEEELIREFRKLADEPKSNTDWSGSFTYPHER